MLKKLIFAVLISLLTYGFAVTQVPNQINYQGMLTDGDGNPVNATLSIQFKIYENAAITVGETPLWEETQSVLVKEGIYSVLLGSVAPVTASVFDGNVRYLGVTIGTDPEMTPRRALVSVGYAYRAHKADNMEGINVENGKVGIGKIDPAEALDVDGNIHASGIIKSGNSIYINGTQTGGSGDDEISASSGKLAILGYPTTSDIKVSIGKTTDPDAKLDVAGDIRATRGIDGITTVYGNIFTAAAAGVYGEVINWGNYGYIGGLAGAYGRHNSGNQGYLGTDKYGVYGRNNNGNYGFIAGSVVGVHGESHGTVHKIGVNGYSSDGHGVEGITDTGVGVKGLCTTNLETAWAGYFSGNVKITGSLLQGIPTSTMDHPLDPANKYLNHSLIGSSDMMNIYNGNVLLGSNGEAEVTLPEWFGAINKEFRYQLTCIGGFAQVYIAEKIRNNKFKIAGGKPGMEVSWQVTGIRDDAYAKALRVKVETEKTGSERGKYLHPVENGVSETLGIDYEHRVRMEKELKRIEQN
jgi:hypothetical protein